MIRSCFNYSKGRGKPSWCRRRARGRHGSPAAVGGLGREWPEEADRLPDFSLPVQLCCVHGQQSHDCSQHGGMGIVLVFLPFICCDSIPQKHFFSKQVWKGTFFNPKWVLIFMGFFPLQNHYILVSQTQLDNYSDQFTGGKTALFPRPNSNIFLQK